MAISPTTALLLTDEQLLLISSVTEEVDLYLANHYKSGQNCIIRHALISDLYLHDAKVLDAFISAYTTAGWTVIKYENSKQGQWLSFSRTEV